MSARVSIEYCGMPGQGGTLKDARADAARKLTTLVDDVCVGPRMVRVAHFAALVWRDLAGWSYSPLNLSGTLPAAGRLYGCSGAETEREAVRAAVHHMAQLAWDHDVADDAEHARALVAGLLASREAEAHMAADLVQGWGWQRRYRVARNLGLPDGDCHAIACRTRDLAGAEAEARNHVTEGCPA